MDAAGGIIAFLLILAAQVSYIKDIFFRQVTPSLLSWAGWFLLMGTSLVAQVILLGWEWSMTGLACSVAGCFAICLIAVWKHNFRIVKSDYLFLIAGIICMIIYQASADSWLTTLFAITADLLLAIPVVKKAFGNPETEKSTSWWYGTASWLITLAIIDWGNALLLLWPVYLLAFNVTLLMLTWFRTTDKS